ncbi:MAG: fused MFS/spermidine synthase [Hyphomicrobiaceae bacterium]
MQDTSPAPGSQGAAIEAVAKSSDASIARTPGLGVLTIFTLTTFLSALLLFAVQPMFAKMVLPVLGGAPSVWAVAMLFFQAALLAGYCYAHGLIRSMPAARTGFVHLAVCALAFIALPIGLPSFMGEPPPGEPYYWQLRLFAVAVGLPFFAVAANAPLLQAWFSATGHAHGSDPYFLYGASNLGSLLALLSYPLLLEPAFGLKQISVIWMLGFGLLVLALTVSFLAMRTAGNPAAYAVPPKATDGTDDAVSWGARLSWIGLALVPSALLTAFTNHVTMDVASAPLLWVLPLALYLLTFVLVFRDKAIATIPTALIIGMGAAALVQFGAERIVETAASTRVVLGSGIAAAIAYVALQRIAGFAPMAALSSVHVISVVVALLALAQTRHESWFISSATGVAVFFSATMVAHRTLYEARPAARHLTAFYLWMSLGGVLGGTFSALIAPQIFSEVLEYPILLALTMACRPGALAIARDSRRDAVLTLWLLTAAAILAIIWLPRVLADLPRLDSAGMPQAAWWLWGPVALYGKVRVAIFEWGWTIVLALLFAVVLAAVWRSPPRQLVMALAMCAAVTLMPSSVRRSDAQRSFFGVYRVYMSGDYNILTHGTTLHGAQRVRGENGEPVTDNSPATYYHPNSPMARTIDIVRTNVGDGGGTRRFGVVGLGAGSLACLASEDETWRFFEIDPVIVGIARDPGNFTYLANCQPNPPDIVIGDARLTMEKEKAGSFDLIIVDAFSSDSVPIHLMTAEAMRLFLDKVGPNGIVLLHISNRYLDLDAVVAATSAAVPGAKGLLISDNEAEGGYAATSSTVAILAKSEAALAPFQGVPGLKPLTPRGIRAWTDDFSDIIGPFMTKLKLDE